MLPCFIVNFNRYHSPRAIVEYLSDPATGVVPVIIDNNSSYKPLLEFYETKPCAIERLSENKGHFVLWNSPEIQAKYEPMCKDGYCLTDSDLDLSQVPKDFLQVLMRGIKLHPNMLKCGLSLEINDLPDNNLGREALGWERNNWSVHGIVEGGYYKAPVDTTFAYYPTSIMASDLHDFDRNLRAPRPYTARHRPWYYTKDNIPEDEQYYLESIKKADGRWSHYSKQLMDLLK